MRIFMRIFIRIFVCVLLRDIYRDERFRVLVNTDIFIIGNYNWYFLTVIYKNSVFFGHSNRTTFDVWGGWHVCRLLFFCVNFITFICWHRFLFLEEERVEMKSCFWSLNFRNEIEVYYKVLSVTNFIEESTFLFLFSKKCTCFLRVLATVFFLFVRFVKINCVRSVLRVITYWIQEEIERARLDSLVF